MTPPKTFEQIERESALLVGAAIARLRESAGITQDEAAHALGIGLQQISRFERGAVAPSIGRLYQLANLFGCRVEELLRSGSPREADQAVEIRAMLARVSPAHRRFVVELVRATTDHLAGPGSKG